METNEELSNGAWKKFLKRHWKMSVLMIGGIAVAAISAVLVFLWVVADLQTTGTVPALLGEWTVGYSITFILHMIFWVLILVGSWVAPIAAIIYYQWYKKLPAKERKEYEKPERKSSGEDFMSFLSGVIWLIIVWFYGMWDTAFQEWTFND
tara:strand:- start:11040 stop:11492 length:453 start_codon:yes stop_codon:yes gene_type:complete